MFTFPRDERMDATQPATSQGHGIVQENCWGSQGTCASTALTSGLRLQRGLIPDHGTACSASGGGHPSIISSLVRTANHFQISKLLSLVCIRSLGALWAPTSISVELKLKFFGDCVLGGLNTLLKCSSNASHQEKKSNLDL